MDKKIYIYKLAIAGLVLFSAFASGVYYGQSVTPVVMQRDKEGFTIFALKNKHICDASCFSGGVNNKNDDFVALAEPIPLTEDDIESIQELVNR